MPEMSLFSDPHIARQTSFLQGERSSRSPFVASVRLWAYFMKSVLNARSEQLMAAMVDHA